MEDCADKVVEELSKVLDVLRGVKHDHDKKFWPKDTRPFLVHDAANNAVWIYVMKGSHVRLCMCGLFVADNMHKSCVGTTYPSLSLSASAG